MKKSILILFILLCNLMSAQTEIGTLKLTGNPLTVNDTTKVDILVRDKTATSTKGIVRKITWPYFSTIINSTVAGNIKTVGGQSLIGVGNVTEIQNSLAASTILGPSATAVNTGLATKQATLVSGTNIKTIETQTLLGSGNIDLVKTDVGLSNVDNTSDANKPVSTAQQTAIDAKVENNLTASTTVAPSKTAVNTALAGKQNTLVSGTNIKTVGGNSLLGSGDVPFPTPASQVQNSLSPASTTLAPSVDAANAGLALKANDNAVIHTTGNESRTGTLNNTGTVTISDGSGGTSLKLERGTGGVYFANLLNDDGLLLNNKANTIRYQTWFNNGNTIIGGTTANIDNNYKFEVRGTTRLLRTGVDGGGLAGSATIASDAKTINDGVAIDFQALNSSSNTATYGLIYSILEGVTAGSHSGSLNFRTINANTNVLALKLTKEGRAIIGNGTDNGEILQVTGKATVSSAPTNSTDVARLLELNGKANTNGSNASGTWSNIVAGNSNGLGGYQYVDALTNNISTFLVREAGNINWKVASPTAVINALGINTKSEIASTLTVNNTDIPTGSDLNTYTTTGLYFCQTNAIAGAGTNFPVANAGKLEVVTRNGDTNTIYQTYHTYQAVNTVYTRARFGGTWSTWALLTNDATLTTGLNNKLTIGGDAKGTTVSVGTTDAQTFQVIAGGATKAQFASGTTTFFGATAIINGSLILTPGQVIGTPPGTGTQILIAASGSPTVYRSATVTTVGHSFTGGTTDIVNFGNPVVAGIRVDGRAYGTNGSVAADFATVGQLPIIYTATATLDFPSTSANNSSELTISVSGAAIGNVVTVGPPATELAGVCFTGRVTAAGVVTLKCNNYSASVKDPASGSYTVKVMP